MVVVGLLDRLHLFRQPGQPLLRLGHLMLNTDHLPKLLRCCSISLVSQLVVGSSEAQRMSTVAVIQLAVVLDPELDRAYTS